MQFDWHETIARRPVFSVDYWPGTPALDREGRKDLLSHLRRIRAYADPAGVRTLSFALGDPLPFARKTPTERERAGGFQLPDLLKGSEAEIERWQRETVKKLEPLIDQYRSQGLRSDRSACPLYLAKACRG